MNQATPGQRQILAAFQASPLWTCTLPTDHAAGTASTAWTPVAAALSAALASSPDANTRRGCHAQLVSLLRQAADQGQRAHSLSDADRATFGTFCRELERAYEPLSH